MKDIQENLKLWEEFLKDPDHEKIYEDIKHNKLDYATRCNRIKLLQDNFSDFKRQKTLEIKRALKEMDHA